MRLASVRRWLAVALALTPACGATLHQLQTRAALDLDCPPQAISAREVDDQTRLARGCGKEAIYVEICTSNDHTDCTWMLNSAIKPVTAQSPPAAPPRTAW